MFADADAAEAQHTAGRWIPEDNEVWWRVSMSPSEPQTEAMASRVVERFGTIDVLVNNAGIAGPNKPLVEVSEEEWDRVCNINLKGVFLCCQAVLPVMLKNRYGRIVNIASIAGKEGNPNLTPLFRHQGWSDLLDESAGQGSLHARHLRELCDPCRD